MRLALPARLVFVMAVSAALLWAIKQPTNNWAQLIGAVAIVAAIYALFPFLLSLLKLANQQNQKRP